MKNPSSRRDHGPEFSDLYPKTDLILGAITLLAFFGGAALAWVNVGASAL